MDVLKIIAEGVTASFRYPHFALTVQPSYTMPPPTTIYGMLCAAVGEWIAPQGIQFAYHFTFAGQADDLEYIHAVSASSGKLKGTAFPKVLEGTIQPFQRRILFKPRLTLYLNRPDLLPAFKSPYYATTLGRSQDLMMYTSVEVIALEQREDVHFEHTLVPYTMAPAFPAGVVSLMPRFLDYENQRQPTWERYLSLTRHVQSSQMLRFDDQPFWCDPHELDRYDLGRGLIFHGFVEDGHEQ